MDPSSAALVPLCTDDKILKFSNSILLKVGFSGNRFSFLALEVEIFGILRAGSGFFGIFGTENDYFSGFMAPKMTNFAIF